MADFVREAIQNEMAKTVDGSCFYVKLYRNGQDMGNLISDTKSLIAQHNLSVSEAKGFLDYMKLVIDGCSCIPQEK